MSNSKSKSGRYRKILFFISVILLVIATFYSLSDFHAGIIDRANELGNLQFAVNLDMWLSQKGVIMVVPIMFFVLMSSVNIDYGIRLNVKLLYGILIVYALFYVIVWLNIAPDRGDYANYFMTIFSSLIGVYIVSGLMSLLVRIIDKKIIIPMVRRKNEAEEQLRQQVEREESEQRQVAEQKQQEAERREESRRRHFDSQFENLFRE